MIRLSFDFSAFEQKAREVGAALDQVPFAIANSMSAAAFKTKDYLAGETWPAHVSVRNNRFMSTALRVEKATKRNLSISIYDRLGRASLSFHEKGGSKQARSNLAVPTSTQIQPRRSGKGVPSSLRPRSLPNSFKTAGKKGGEVIYQRTGKYLKSGSRKQRGFDNRKLRLMYVLRPRATIRGAVPFHADFRREMLDEMRKAFPIALRNAMRTRGLKGRYERQAALGRRRSTDHGNSGPQG